MENKSRSIRTFIGAKNYEESRTFYKALGFEESVVSETMIYFKIDENLGFYLQDYYIKKWINNSMVFLEVEDLPAFEKELKAKKLDTLYKYVRISEIKKEPWGQELFMHDPSGVLWHIGSFKN